MNTAPRLVPLRILSGATLALMAQQCFICIFVAYVCWALFGPTKDLWAQGFDSPLSAFALLVLALESIGPLLALVALSQQCLPDSRGSRFRHFPSRTGSNRVGSNSKRRNASVFNGCHLAGVYANFGVGAVEFKRLWLKRVRPLAHRLENLLRCRLRLL